jgi:O-antigen/teichoic acid export membrane protein
MVKAENNEAKRGAAMALSIRVASAGIAFVSQIVLARWLGAYEFGIYTYVWVWVNIIGTLCAAGFATTVIRFLSEYRESHQPDLARGFLHTGRLFSVLAAVVCMTIGYTTLSLWPHLISDYYLVPAALALLCLPAFALTDFQDGIGRAKGWIDLALVPPYILRPLLLFAFIGLALTSGKESTAVTAISAAIGATWVTAFTQYCLQKRRMHTRLPAGPRKFRLGFWLKVSLPVIALESFGLLMMQLDILLLDLYVEPQQIAIYFAAARTISLVNFLHFSIQAVALPRFATMYANRDEAGQRNFLNQCRKWMFSLSLVGTLALLFLGKTILSLFGPEFVAGYPVMVVLSIGLLIRALAGPLQGLLVVTGRQNVAAFALAVTVVINITLNILLIPKYGLMGAAIATSIAFGVESLLFLVANHRVARPAEGLPGKGQVA